MESNLKLFTMGFVSGICTYHVYYCIKKYREHKIHQEFISREESFDIED